jgi:hypothetical protein
MKLYDCHFVSFHTAEKYIDEKYAYSSLLLRIRFSGLHTVYHAFISDTLTRCHVHFLWSKLYSIVYIYILNAFFTTSDIHLCWCSFIVDTNLVLESCSFYMLSFLFVVRNVYYMEKCMDKLRGIYEICVVYYFFTWDVSEAEIVFFKKRTYIWSMPINFCPSYKLCDDPSSLVNSSAAVQIKHKGGMNDRNDLTSMHLFF